MVGVSTNDNTVFYSDYIQWTLPIFVLGSVYQLKEALIVVQIISPYYITSACICLKFKQVVVELWFDVPVDTMSVMSRRCLKFYRTLPDPR